MVKWLFDSLLRVGARYIISISHWGWSPQATSNLHKSVIQYLIPWSSHFSGIYDVHRLLTCPIWASIEGVMTVLTTANLGATPGQLEYWALSLGNAHSNCHISWLTPSIEALLSILEIGHHKLPNVYGLILMTPSSQRPGSSPTLGSIGSSHLWH